MDSGVFPHVPLAAHALLDSGGGQKLERFGDRVLVRPDPQAMWPQRAPKLWEAADLVFVRESDRGGRWEPGGTSASAGGAKLGHAGARTERSSRSKGRARGGRDGRGAGRGQSSSGSRGSRGSTGPKGPTGPGAEQETEETWTVDAFDLSLVLRATPFKHVGLFPEQATNWEFVRGLSSAFGKGEGRLLNLFGYTGVASLAASHAGFQVTHVDASRSALAWTRANLEASGMRPDALRLVLDDALAFAKREARREQRYHVILVDPPHYGRGPKGEVWRFEERIAELLDVCADLLDDRAALVFSAYAIGISPLTMRNLLTVLDGGTADVGELSVPEQPLEGAPVRRLPCGFCARWTRGGLEPDGSSRA